MKGAGVISALGLLAFVAGRALRPMEETDLFFRLATGAEILRTGAVPKRNLFSFTYPEHPYLDSAWLFDVGAAALHRAGGFPAVVVAKASLLALVFAAAFALCRRRGAGPAASALALLAAALCMDERLVERPHLFSFAGVVATLALVDAAARRPRLLLAAPPLVALWANLHAGAFLGPVLLAAAAAGAWLDGRRGGHARPRAGALAAAAGAAAPALLATPVGAGLARYLAFHVGIHEIHPVDEFRPIAWAWDAPLVLHLAACGVAALLLARSGRAPWRQVLPAALLAALAARSVRFGAEAALALAPLGAAGLTALAPRLPGGGAAAPLPLGVALVAAALAPRIAAARAGGPLLDVGLREAALPLAALRFVDEAGLRDRMYNDFEIGGYLAWSGWPRHRVFVDPRLPAYPLEFHRLLGRADLDRATWDAALAGHGVDAALLGDAGVNRRVAWWDPARWALVYRAEDARVFVRRGPRHRAVIAAREIPATFAFTDAEGTRTLPILAPPPGSPVPACEWELRLGDLYFDLDGGGSERAIEAAVRALAHPRGCLAPAREAAAAAWVGALLRERGDPAAALALLDRAVEHAPGDPATLVNRALALEALGRRGEARGAWEAVAGATRDADLAARARARAAAPRP